jgi:hypothetical protein
VRIVSRTVASAEIRPWVEDRRRFGVRITRLVLRSTNEARDIPVDHPVLTEGWWDVERDGHALRRWTNGEAVLPLPTVSGPALLEIHLNGTIDYVVTTEPELATERRRAA